MASCAQRANLQLVFRRKGGVLHAGGEDAWMTRVAWRFLDLPGQALPGDLDEAHLLRGIGSGDVSSDLHEVAGDQFSAKDFRPWHGTVLAFQDTLHSLQSGDSSFTLK
jgi:DNA topoisomerase-1